ncbi:uncharacterized protein TRAVEDRAFT_62781 [Trametes versicolor FP-101664 SS1]|uniref:uncharacterized protein n=1 Tax=Trametes versicolor (strain FP-101664) TaxID=717944 RepID=UPI0004622B4F|nr:uncharacterized protein TRAVEDRAFT_62781 [Trametes versicolor FP-101664 SS1]EIW63102.1 hypothetical protein TRAVEDRAFT_62781 [Trametes versicolor FP-101664 SS1]
MQVQRRTSQTFQRLRKLSDSLVSAIVPNPSRKSAGQDSFLNYDQDKKGWTASFSSGSARAHAPIHRRPSFRNGQHVSKEDIRYPLLEPSLEQLQLDRQRSADALSARARSKRPERPREEDLPYGAPGSIPKALAPPYVAPAPAVGARRPHKTRAHAEEARSSVPFPHPGSGARERERAGEVGRMQREKPLPEPPREARAGGRAQQPPAPRPAPARDTFLNLFASASVPASKQAPTARAPAVAREVYDPALPRPYPYAVAQPVTPQPYTRVRRISSTGDVHPPPHHSRPRDENAPPRDRERERRHPDLRPSRSTPLRLQENRGREREPVPLPPPPAPVYPYPVSPQRALVHVEKPRPRNVPRDVSPEYNPQRLPTPRRSREELRSHYEAHHQQSVAAQVQAGLRVQQTAAPRPVRVDAAQEHARPMAAQMVRPGRDAERERERERRAEREREREARHLARAQDKERRRMLRPTHTRAIEVEYYGMSDAFSQEITVALADPDRAYALPADWRVGPAVPSGGAYGTVRPLVTKKSRQMAGAM